MKLTVVDPANRHGELVAHSASKRARLGKREVMRIRRRTAAHKASLLLHELPVVLIAQAHRFAQSTDHPAAGPLVGHHRSFLAGVRGWLADGYEVFVGDSIRRPVRGQTIGRRGRYEGQIVAVPLSPSRSGASMATRPRTRTRARGRPLANAARVAIFPT